jgi:hypothetical protein
MKHARELQMRYPVQAGEELRAFMHDGVVFEIIGNSMNSDIITRYSPFHRCLQYKAVGDDGKNYEVYVYYYTRFEGGSFAVVDAIRDKTLKKE